MTISVLLADDEHIPRTGLAALLGADPEITVLAEAADGRTAVDLTRRLRPDVVLMDLKMPVLDGVAATREIAADRPDDAPAAVLVLSSFHDDELVQRALRAGAVGYLLKHAAPRDLGAAIRAVAAGQAWIDPAVAPAVLAGLRGGGPNPSAEVLVRLTPREREVLVLMARGLTNDEIGLRLHVTTATTRTHVARVLMKTGSRSRAEAVVVAYESSLVVPGAP